jgi:hypothetical protein
MLSAAGPVNTAAAAAAAVASFTAGSSTSVAVEPEAIHRVHNRCSSLLAQLSRMTASSEMHPHDSRASLITAGRDMLATTTVHNLCLFVTQFSVMLRD